MRYLFADRTLCSDPMIDRVWLRGDRSWKIGQNIQISISLASIAILIFIVPRLVLSALSAKAAVGSRASVRTSVSRIESSLRFIDVPHFLPRVSVPREKRKREIAPGYIPVQGSTPLQ